MISESPAPQSQPDPHLFPHPTLPPPCWRWNEFSFFVFCLFRATLIAYGGSQTRGLIEAVAVCWSTPQPQQCQIRALSATYTTAQGNPLSRARDRTHNPMVPRRICFHCTTTRIPGMSFLIEMAYLTQIFLLPFFKSSSLFYCKGRGLPATR